LFNKDHYIVCLFFQNDKEEHKKAVFILSSPVFGTTKVVLQDIIQNSSFKYCVLVTSAHARVHQFAKYGDHQEGIDVMSIFHILEQEMLEWMGNTVCKNICIPKDKILQGSIFTK
jgi:hypothetical protein